jgi:alcohol dehydrogenase class IV
MAGSIEPQVFEYSSIGRVLFGVGTVKQAGAEATRLAPGRKCLIVTDPGIVKAGLIDAILQSIEQEGFTVDVCDLAEAEPTVSTYRAVLAVAQEKDPSILVGVGGGSSMDVAKAVACALTNPRPLEEYLGKEFDVPGIPVITIPTTSGTGAEVTPDVVVRLPEQKVKSVFLNARARLAIVDPALTLSLPPGVTAATGIDALSHAVESALSKMATPLTQALALESIRLISGNLRTAVADGSNLEARANMAWATLIEGFSESNAGDVEGHAVAHLLGGYYRVHHGQACSIALPYCMKYNLPVNTPILARIARAMDESLLGTPRNIAEQGICAVDRLIQDVGALRTISDIPGASKEHLPELVELYCTHPDIASILEIYAKRGIPSKAEAADFLAEMFEPFSIGT